MVISVVLPNMFLLVPSIVRYMGVNLDPKKTIAVFFVLAVIGIAIGYGVTWVQSQNPDGEYDYTGKTAESFEGKIGGIITPSSDDKIFYIAEFTLKNKEFDSGISTTKLLWILHVDSQRINVNILTEDHPDFKSVTVEKGKTVKYTVVFEIPKNAVLENLSMTYNYLSTDEALYLVRNTGLGPVSVSDIVCTASRTER